MTSLNAFICSPDAYGYVLGTSALCSLLMIALSFVPPKALKRSEYLISAPRIKS